MPGEAGGLWYCGTQRESCNGLAKTFGIEPGFFADFRNLSSSSSAAATPTKSTTASLSVITSTLEPFCASETCSEAGPANTSSPTSESPTPPKQRSNTLSGGAIIGIAIGSVCAGFGIGVLFLRLRRGRKYAALQPATGDKNNMQALQRPNAENSIRELAAERYHGVELG